jgi:signal transduction histidine kinase
VTRLLNSRFEERLSERTRIARELHDTQLQKLLSGFKCASDNAGEALRNAFSHVQARRIDLEIHYAESELRLRIRDDWKTHELTCSRWRRQGGTLGLAGYTGKDQTCGR